MVYLDIGALVGLLADRLLLQTRNTLRNSKLLKNGPRTAMQKAYQFFC